MSSLCIDRVTSESASFENITRRWFQAGMLLRSTIRKNYSKWKASTLSIVFYLGIVGMVSLYDMYLTVKYAVYLKYMEQNPLGRWLMQLDSLGGGSPDLTLFLTAKSLGTIVVLGCMFYMVQRSRRLGHPVAIGVTSCQLLLAGYLTLGTTPS